MMVVSASAFGMLPWLVNVAQDHGATTLGQLTTRFLVATPLLFVLRIWRIGGGSWPTRTDSTALFALGAIIYFVQSSMYFGAVVRIDTSLATILFYTYPLMVVLAIWLFRKQSPSRAVTTCLLIAFVGVTMSTGTVNNVSSVGVLMGIGAAISYAAYLVLSEPILKRVDALTALCFVVAGATFAFVIASIIAKPDFASDSRGWMAVIVLAIICTVIAMGTLFAAVSRIGASESAVIATIEPIVTITIGASALNEHLNIAQVIGALTVLVAVGLLARFEASYE